MNDPFIADHWARCEALGLPSRFELSADGQYRATRVPLMREAVSYTMSGKAAVRRPLSDEVTEPNIGALLLFHYPTTWNHILGDHAVTFRVLPLGPTQTAGHHQMAGAQGRGRRRRLFARRTDRRSGPRPTTRTGASSRKTSAASPRRPSSPAPIMRCTKAA